MPFRAVSSLLISSLMIVNEGLSLTIVNKGLSLTIVNKGTSLLIINETASVKKTIILQNDCFENNRFWKTNFLKKNSVLKTIFSFSFFVVVFLTKRKFKKKMKTLTSLPVDDGCFPSNLRRSPNSNSARRTRATTLLCVTSFQKLSHSF